MAVTVRLFAALREAAGTSQVEVAAATVPAIVGDLCARFGEPFATRVRVASGLVDGDRVELTDDVAVADGSELALLPPFSGGSAGGGSAGGGSADGRSAATPDRMQVHRLLAIGSLLVPGLLVAALFTTRSVFGVVALVVAVGSLVDLHATLARSHVRTVLPVTLLLGVGPPLLLLLAPDAWVEWAGGIVALGVMAAFLVTLASSRRQETSTITGATLLVAMIVAVGGSALLALRDMDAPAQVAGLLLTVAVTDLAVVVTGGPERADRIRTRLLVAVAVAVPAALVLFASGARTADTVLPVAGLALTAVVAALASARLRQLLRRPAVAAGANAPALLVGTADAVLLAAPIALLWLHATTM